MSVVIVFETHSLSEDNERGVATGWAHGRLSEAGRVLAAELGDRRRADGLAAVLSSDLGRAVETVSIAFAGCDLPILLDWRLRECDYGDWNEGPVDRHTRERPRRIDSPFPNGESWRQATGRVAGVLPDLLDRWDGRRVLIVGHMATLWAFEHHIDGVPLEELIGPDAYAEETGWRRPWREGWEFTYG